MSSSDGCLRIPVDLGDRAYEVIVGEDVLDRLGGLMRAAQFGGKVAVVSNPKVLDLYGDAVKGSLVELDPAVAFHTIAAGEESKNLDTVRELYDRLLDEGFERSGTIVGLGGGQVGDVAGFVAATLLRGVNFVQVPTTLLAQVDAAIGGKVGVNHGSGKNLIGTFYQPRLVLADVTTLKSLPTRELRSGIAEVIKYGCIQDAGLFESVEEKLDAMIAADGKALSEAIAVCCRIKAGTVGADERELTGRRTVLNFGHTVAHALESLTGYTRFLHGEAVAIGMIAAAHMATAVTGFPEEQLERLVALIRRSGFNLDLQGVTDDAIIERTRADKKVVDGRVRYVLLKRIGEVVVRADVSDDGVRDALRYVRALS